MTALYIMVSFAAGGFFVLFGPWTKDTIAFWPTMSVLTGLLAAVSLILDRKRLARIYRFDLTVVVLGLLSAAFLYAVFFVGHFLSTRILPFAAGQVSGIYSVKGSTSPLVIALLLLLVIGPAEEIFWRGFVMRRLCSNFGAVYGWLFAAAVYAGVHLWSFNFMLIAAAAVCGAFWGLVFLFGGRLWVCIISHAVWDVVILLLLPIR